MGPYAGQWGRPFAPNFHIDPEGSKLAQNTKKIDFPKPTALQEGKGRTTIGVVRDLHARVVELSGVEKFAHFPEFWDSTGHCDRALLIYELSIFQDQGRSIWC